ncbi:MAG: S-adenosylmethionine:tRNA ribosyltransferase-isomerase [Odoribacter sp.]
MEFALEELKNIRIEDYTYDLPDERIAKFPLEKREASKLLLYEEGKIQERHFFDLPDTLRQGQTLIFNNTKVIHARIFFRKATGAMIEVFCLEPFFPVDYAQNFSARGECDWTCMVGNLKKWKGGKIECTFRHEGEECCLIAEKREQQNGEVIIHFTWDKGISFSEVLEGCGRIPIPPYLNRESEASDEIRYQTVYSREEGSVAAPTAGLHFTKNILTELKNKGIQVTELTLHVGAGTFRPVKANTIGGHDMHTEHLVVSRHLAEQLRDKADEIIAVGTTSVRTLESLYWMGVKRLEGIDEFFTVSQWEAYTLPAHYTLRQSMNALIGWFDDTRSDLLKASTTIIILPGYIYRVIDAMFTNFHQPQSTLLLLVAAAVGDDWKKIYDYALSHDFRFLSYGDGSLLKIKNKNNLITPQSGH